MEIEMEIIFWQKWKVRMESMLKWILEIGIEIVQQEWNLNEK